MLQDNAAFLPTNNFLSWIFFDLGLSTSLSFPRYPPAPNFISVYTFLSICMGNASQQLVLIAFTVHFLWLWLVQDCLAYICSVSCCFDCVLITASLYILPFLSQRMCFSFVFKSLFLSLIWCLFSNHFTSTQGWTMLAITCHLPYFLEHLFLLHAVLRWSFYK